MRLLLVSIAMTLAASLGVAGCGSDDCVNGSGAVISQTLDLSRFDGFDFQIAGEVTAVPGATQQVMVRGQENVIDLLNLDVINGVWEIGFVQCVSNVNGLQVELTLPELTSIALSGAGTVEAETNAAAIDTILSGAGTIRLTGETMSQTILLDGSGTVEAFELTTEETSVDLSGQGTVNVTANEELTVNLSGAGTVFYKGDPQLDVQITGAGTVVAAD